MVAHQATEARHDYDVLTTATMVFTHVLYFLLSAFHFSRQEFGLEVQPPSTSTSDRTRTANAFFLAKN